MHDDNVTAFTRAPARARVTKLKMCVIRLLIISAALKLDVVKVSFVYIYIVIIEKSR